ncbi:MAG: hypothetical protein ABSC18_04950, partial [Verrucomicrobiota bacterium]
LADNAEFGGGWKFYVFHDLPCGRFSSNFQPFFLNSCGMAVYYFCLCTPVLEYRRGSPDSTESYPAGSEIVLRVRQMGERRGN